MVFVVEDIFFSGFWFAGTDRVSFQSSSGGSLLLKGPIEVACAHLQGDGGEIVGCQRLEVTIRRVKSEASLVDTPADR